MARVTVEDCLKHVDNRFQLVILAAMRVQQLMRNAKAKVACDGDKPTVIALREIAAGYVDIYPHEEVTALQFNLSLLGQHMQSGHDTMQTHQQPAESESIHKQPEDKPVNMENDIEDV